MAVNLKSAEAEAILKRLAEETGESLTEAATQAFRERLARLEAEKAASRQRDLSFVLDLIDEGRRAPVVDSRPIKVIRDELWDET